MNIYDFANKLGVAYDSLTDEDVALFMGTAWYCRSCEYSVSKEEYESSQKLAKEKGWDNLPTREYPQCPKCDSLNVIDLRFPSL